MPHILCDDVADRLADHQLLKIFDYVCCHITLVRISLVSKQWNRVSRDESLWRKLFFHDFQPTLLVNQACLSWIEEYKRVTNESPAYCTETLRDHTDEVLHVAFCHDGSKFASCSKDACVKVWSNGHPCNLDAEFDFKLNLSWSRAQYCDFSADDKLLLVSGIKDSQAADQLSNTVGGEIAILWVSPGELIYRCRTSIKPYDFFGCWYSDKWFLSTDCSPLSNLISFSTLSLVKSSQEVHSEKERVTAKLFKFLNINGSTVRMVLVGNYVCDSLKCVVALTGMQKHSLDSLQEPANDEINLDSSRPGKELPSLSSIMLPNSSSDFPDKLLIFTSGSLFYTPHLVGFKLIKGLEAQEKLVEEVMTPRRLTLIGERLKVLRERQAQEVEPINEAQPEQLPFEQAELAEVPVDLNAAFLALFDTPDRTIDLRGHVNGMALSPDHQQLFCNVRPWADQPVENTDPLNPPGISERIELRVIDLRTLTQLQSVQYAGHLGFTLASGCFYIFPAVSRNYVASGSEDNAAYLWDRRFGNLIKKLPHDSVVNAVAFSPLFDLDIQERSAENVVERNAQAIKTALQHQILVTVSDDKTLKIWRSKDGMKMLGLI